MVEFLKLNERGKTNTQQRHMKDQERWVGDGRQQIGADRRGEPEGRTGGRITF